MARPRRPPRGRRPARTLGPASPPISRSAIRVGAVDIYPISAAIAEACQHLTVADRAVAADVVSLPWLAHTRALLDRVIDIGFTLTVDRRLPDTKNLRSLPLWTETRAFALISAHHPLAAATARGRPCVGRRGFGAGGRGRSWRAAGRWPA